MDDDQTHGDGRAGREAASAMSTGGPAAAMKPEIEMLDEDESMESAQDGVESQWNQDEHTRFMQALETYGGEQSGDEWRKITAVVHTRSMDEVRLHGQLYLQHLMHLHQLQQQPTQTAQQQQSRLLQLSQMGRSPLLVHTQDPLSYPLTASREIQNNQNDRNGPNNNSHNSGGADNSGGAKAAAPATKAKSAGSKGKMTPSPLSAAALSVANAMNAHAFIQQGETQPVVAKKSNSSAGGRKVKVWSFQEDKVLETALASWQTGKPYSWPKIAATLPGKTAKDVRLRYEQLVEDVSSIETVGNLKHPPPTATTTPTPASLPPKPPTSTTAKAAHLSTRPPTHSGLSSRIAPPPPIQVPPPSAKGKATSSLLDSPGVFPASARGRIVMTPSFGGSGISGMLSPTFLDFLANEDKQPLPYSGLNDLVSPASGGPLASPMGLDMGSRGRNRSLMTPKGFATPRIWHEFLAEDFKFDAKAPSPRLLLDGSRQAASHADNQQNERMASDQRLEDMASGDDRRLHDLKSE